MADQRQQQREHPDRCFALTVAYDGRRYAGWQVQPNQATIQGEVERVLAQLIQQPIRVRAAGRTDAGVHAEGQLVSFRAQTRLDQAELHSGLNALLPDDICVTAVYPAVDGFDARRHNQGKHYRYRIHNDRSLPLAWRGKAHLVRQGLDPNTMARAAEQLVGRHDFAAFRAADCDRQTTVRTLFRCSISQYGKRLQIDVEGEGFLKNMVRIIAGTLIDVGRGRLDLAAFGELLGGSRRRIEAGMTAPAAGLTLVRVFFDPNHASYTKR